MFKSISQESTFAVFFIEHSGVYIYGDQRKTTHYAIKNYDYIELSLLLLENDLDGRIVIWISQCSIYFQDCTK